MRNLFINIGNYFSRLFRALFNISKKIKEPKKPVLPERFDVEHIKEIIDRTPVKETANRKAINDEFIANRKAINEYKEWYSKLVGFNPPPENIKKLIEMDSKMDGMDMNRLFYQMSMADIKRFREMDERNFKRTGDTKANPKSNMDSDKLMNILSSNKEILDKMVSNENKGDEIIPT